MATQRDDASSARWLLAHALTLDAAAAEIVTAMRGVGIEPILLKGPSLARWLYDDGALRAYGDIDLLVAPGDFRAAHRLLERHGFRYGERGTDDIDLVETIGGPKAPPRDVWSVLCARTEPMALVDVEVNVLDRPARALHVVMHAWKHQHGMDLPLEDLRRLVARLDDDEWPHVLELARALDAEEAFGGGLRLVPEGERVARLLGLPERPSTETVLREASAPPQLLLFDRVVTARGWRRRLGLVATAVAPPPETMRLRFRVARRGPRGLAAAYAVRTARLALGAPAGLVVWLRARRRSGT